jgi:hypothetical protein
MKRRKAQATELERLTSEARHDWQQFCASLVPLLGPDVAADEARQTEALQAWISRAPDTLGDYLSGFYLSEIVRPMLPLVFAHRPEERAAFMRKLGDMVVAIAQASMDEAVHTAETHGSP